jgi:hypothetical protein
MNTADLIGIFGVICYQIAYAGMQLGFMQREGRNYLILNLLGPCCLLYSLIFHFNFAAAVSQVLWLVWSCLGMAKTGLARRQPAVAPVAHYAGPNGLPADTLTQAVPAQQALLSPTQAEAEFTRRE